MDASRRLAVVDEAQATAEARSRAYGLFAALLAGGGHASALDRARSIPELAAVLDGDDDELAASHHGLFAMEIFPLASVYLDRDMLAGSREAESCAASYQEAGFGVSHAEPADHLGVQLAFLGHLAGAESDARRDGLVNVAGKLVDRQRRFLARLTSWLPPLVVAAEERDPCPWTHLLQLAVEVLADHALDLEVVGQPPELAPEGNPLERDKTGLRSIARYLCAPARSGVLLTRSDIAALSERASMPRGFGSRVQMVGNLLVNAAEYGTAGELADAIGARLTDRAERYRRMAEDPVWVSARAWAGRADAAADVCRQLAVAARELAPGQAD